MLLTAEQNCIRFRYAKSSTRWKKFIMFSKDMAIVIHTHSPLYSGHFCFSHSSLQTSTGTKMLKPSGEFGCGSQITIPPARWTEWQTSHSVGGWGWGEWQRQTGRGQRHTERNGTTATQATKDSEAERETKREREREREICEGQRTFYFLIFLPISFK